MRRLALAMAGVAIVCVALLVSSRTLREKIPKWIRSRGVATVAQSDPTPPRWVRERTSHPLSDPAPFVLTPDPSSENPVESARVEIDGVSRDAVLGAVPHSFDVTVEVPPDGELWLSLNQFLPASIGRSISYEIHASATGETLYRARLPARHRDWRNAAVDLSALGTGLQTLRFSASPSGATETDVSAVAYWGDLRLRSRTSDVRPDITVVLVDTLRADHVGAYGHARPTTPFIDGLARNGVRFERAIASGPWTNPSILSIMTGLYPRDLWLPAALRDAKHKSLPETVPTLAEALSNAGYHTIAASDHPGVRMTRYGRGFDAFTNLAYVSGAGFKWRKTEARRLLDRLERTLASRGSGPVFSYVHILYPHRPLEPPPGYLDLVGATLEGLDPESMDAELERYDAEIRVADDVVRDVHATLLRAGWDESGIFVVLSDHGEAFGEHAHEEHGNSLYNELLHIPLIIHGPGRVPAGRVVEPVVRLVDLFPTLLEFAGAPAAEAVRGESLLRMLDSEDAPPRIAYSEFPHSRIIDAYAVQSDALKGVFGDPEFGEEAWFDLRVDPDEMRALESRPPGAETLVEYARALRAAPRLHEESPVGRGQNDEVEEKLKLLGYVD